LFELKEKELPRLNTINHSVIPPALLQRYDVYRPSAIKRRVSGDRCVIRSGLVDPITGRSLVR
jgi:hypothetical protein